jgi:Protein of unknown function (DUF3313)
MNNQCRSRAMQHKADCGATQESNGKVARRYLLSQVFYLSLLAGSMLLIGLNTQADDSAKVQEKVSRQASGFLADYSKLQPDPKNDDLLIYWDNKDTLKNLSKFVIDPATVYLLPEAQSRGVDPEDMAKLTQYFTKAITDELNGSGNYEVVTNPGPGVTVLRLAITNVEPTGGKTNAVVKGAAMAASTAVAPGASMVVPRVSVGRVAIEGEMIDSVSGEQIVEFMTSKSGRRYFSGLNAYKKWGDIEAAFRAWAKNFRERLDKMHES